MAHQRDDQAETFLMRHRRRTGPGLAAMAAIVEHRDLRLLRPLLGVSRGRIEATLRARGQAWIDDPSNRDRRFERVRARQAMPKLALRGWGPDRLAAEVARCAVRRREQETRLIALLGAAVRVHPMGFATIDRARLLEAGGDERARALARVLTVVAGASYPPSFEACARLMENLLQGPSRATLGGCLVLAREADWTIVREPRAAREALPAAGCPALWDGRFAVAWRGPPPTGLIIRRLGRDGWRQVRTTVGARPGVSSETHLSLPALWSLDDVVCVPHLDIRRIQGTFTALYRPRQMLLSPHLAGFVHGTDAAGAPGDAGGHGAAC
jgi:tRNA(Ile)-lysidine synthase